MEYLMTAARKYPRLTLLILSLVTVFFAFCLKDIQVKTTIESLVPANDPGLNFYSQFRQDFESDEYFILVLKAENIFTPAVLDVVKELTDKLAAIPQVTRVVSLSNMKLFTTDAEGKLGIAPLIPPGFIDAGRLAQIERETVAHPLLRKNLISPDGSTTAVMARVQFSEDDQRLRTEVTRGVRDLVRQYQDRIPQIYLLGIPVLKTYLLEDTVHNLVLFVGLSFAVAVLGLIIIFRSWRGLGLPLITVISSLIWTGGIISLWDVPLTAVSSMLVAPLTVLGIAVSIHLLVRFNDNYREGKSVPDAVRETVSSLFIPCLLSSVTTAVGFGSLAISDITPIRDFGIFAALGVIITFIIAITGIPAALSLLPPPQEKLGVARLQRSIQEKVVGVVKFDLMHPVIVIGVVLICLLISLLGARRVEVQTDILSFFKPDHYLNQAYRFVEKNLTPMGSLEIVVDGKSEETFAAPENWQKIETFRDRIQEIPEIDSTVCLSDYLKELNRVLRNGDMSHFELPSTKEAISQYLLLAQLAGEDESIRRLADPTLKKVRISGRMKVVDSRRLGIILDQIKNIAAEVFSGDFRVTVTGTAALFHSMVNTVVKEQFENITLAIGVITLFMMLMFRSVPLGLLIMIPNLIPIVMLVGFMGLLRFPLDTGTMMVAAIAIGIAVDDTIHFTYPAIRALKGNGDIRTAMIASAQKTGRPIATTSIILALGFFSCGFSYFQPQANAGILCGTTIIFALAADLLVTPLLLKRYFRNQRGE